MTQIFRSKRSISLLCTAVVLCVSTLALRGETQRAQLNNEQSFVLFDDASATLSNGIKLDPNTPLRTVSGQGLHGKFSVLREGQSLLWKDEDTQTVAGMYDVFVSNPTITEQAVSAKMSAFTINAEGDSTNITYSIPFGNTPTRTETFNGHQWRYVGDLFLEEGASLHSIVFATLPGSTGKETPVDGILFREKTFSNNTRFTFEDAQVQQDRKWAEVDLQDSGRLIVPGKYVILGTWEKIADLSPSDKANPNSNTPSPYVQFAVFGTTVDAQATEFTFVRPLDLRNRPSGKNIDGILWQELGTVDIPANTQTITVQWMVANPPGGTGTPGGVVWFPVTIESSALHAAAESSATSASTTSASTTSASSDSEESEESTSSSTTTSTSASSTSTSTSTPVLDINSSASSSTATSQASTGPLDLTPGSAVLDNTTANFYTRGFAAEAGGYRNSFHGAAPAQSVQSDVGGAYAGWRMPTIEHGEYDAYLTWPSVPGGSPAAPITISTVVPSNGSYLKISKTVVVNQSRAPMGPTVADKTWQKIARITIDEFSGHNSVEFRVNDKTPGSKVVVDALLLRKIPQ
jgi:hypothetical protein